MHSSSRSKPIVDRLSRDESPEIPILETGDLPADEDWAVMRSFAVDQGDVDNTNPDTVQITIASSDYD